MIDATETKQVQVLPEGWMDGALTGPCPGPVSTRMIGPCGATQSHTVIPIPIPN
jgi:hypothetical protein